MKLSTLAKKEQFVSLFAGKPGAGKTGAICSFAEAGPIKVYDLDKRIRGVFGVAEYIGKQNLDKIEVVQPNFEDGWSKFDDMLEMDLVKQKSGNFPYKTVAFESAATMQKFLVSDSQRLRGNGKGKSRGTINFWTPDDYNYCSMGFFAFYYEYAMKMNCNVIVSAWIVDKWGKVEKDGEENPYGANEVIGEKILLTEKLAEELPGYFDEVYTFSKEISGVDGATKYVASFENTVAKTCHPSLRKKKRLDFTNKSFYKEWIKLTEHDMDEFMPPKPPEVLGEKVISSSITPLAK